MWGGRFSADMISGLPMHTDRAFLGELAELVSFHPDHVSLYSLVVEKHTPLGRALERGILPYDTDAADGQWLAGRDFLERNGYGQYEVSNFAHPGAESIHNQAYWRLENYIGVGAGATGSVYGESGNAGMRWTNFNDIEVYTAFWNEKHQGKELPRSVEVLDQSTEEFEFLMMGFRMLCGISSRTYTSRFGGILGQRIGAYDGGLFSKWQQQGLAVLKENGTDVRFALTREGILFLNSFLESL
jgi:oxygen-independent coproporphyrinogen-3 oxidase